MTVRWTKEIDAEADVFFATLNETEIRRRQDLAAQQIEMAHAKGLTDAIEDLRRMEDALARSMMQRL